MTDTLILHIYTDPSNINIKYPVEQEITLFFRLDHFNNVIALKDSRYNVPFYLCCHNKHAEAQFS